VQCKQLDSFYLFNRQFHNIHLKTSLRLVEAHLVATPEIEDVGKTMPKSASEA
jgi:hypothetical protein